MANRMGSGLVHLHLCDGNGASADEHLVPGRGTQPTAEVCQMLANSDFAAPRGAGGHHVGARSEAEREELLIESLDSPVPIDAVTVQTEHDHALVRAC